MTPRTPQLPPHDSLTVIEDQERPKLVGSGMIVCYNRCLYCGRMTPHEICHLHSRVIHRQGLRLGRFDEDGIEDSVEPEVEYQRRWGRSQSRAWRRHFPRPAEVCEDSACPQLAADWQ